MENKKNEKGSKKSKNVFYYYPIAHDFYLQKNFDPATENIDKALSFDPKNILCLALKVRILWLKGNHRKSFSLAQKIKRIYPNSYLSYTILMWIYPKIGNLTEACTNGEKALKLNPKELKVPIRRDLIGYYFQLKNLDKAKYHLEKLLIHFPCDEVIHANLCYIRMSKLDHEKEFNDAWNSYIKYRNRQIDLQTVIESWERILKIFPKDAFVLNITGRLYSYQGNFQKSVKLLKDSLKGNPFFLTAYLNFVSLLEKKGEFDEAIKIIKKGLERNNKNALLHYNLAIFLSHKGLKGESEKELDQACMLNKQNAGRCHWMFANFLRELNRLDESDHHLTLIGDLDPQNPGAQFHSSCGYFFQRKPEEARKYAQKCLDLVPGNEYGQVALAQSYLIEQPMKLKEAKQLFEEILDNNPKNLFSLICMGIIFFFEDKAREARQKFELAKTCFPPNTPKTIISQIDAFICNFSLTDSLANEDFNGARGYLAIYKEILPNEPVSTWFCLEFFIKLNELYILFSKEAEFFSPLSWESLQNLWKKFGEDLTLVEREVKNKLGKDKNIQNEFIKSYLSWVKIFLNPIQLTSEDLVNYQGYKTIISEYLHLVGRNNEIEPEFEDWVVTQIKQFGSIDLIPSELKEKCIEKFATNSISETLQTSKQFLGHNNLEYQKIDYILSEVGRLFQVTHKIYEKISEITESFPGEATPVLGGNKETERTPSFEIGVVNSKPYVKINGQDVVNLQERFFVDLCFLSVARKKRTEGWVEQTVDLGRPQFKISRNRELHALRSFLERWIAKKNDSEVIPILPKKGKIRLEIFEPKYINIDKSICDFESIHWQAIKNALDKFKSIKQIDIPEEELTKDDKVIIKEYKSKIEKEGKSWLRHNDVIKKACEIMGWKFREQTEQEKQVKQILEE